MTQSAIVRPISSAPSAVARRANAALHDHFVQFYESERFLADAVANFVAAGLAAREPVIVIATAEHRDAILAGLHALSVDVDAARRRGRLTMLDARQALAKIMDGALPDAGRFHRVIGAVLDSAARKDSQRRLRAYGEMANVLWKEAKHDAALRLEALWNELGTSRDFSLLCAYELGDFYEEPDDRTFQDICRQHSHVVPTERYIRASGAERLLEISILQRRAAALEHEIMRRQALERRLRDALVARHQAEQALRVALAGERAAREEAESTNGASGKSPTSVAGIGAAFSFRLSPRP